MEIVPMGTTSIQYEGIFDDQKFYNFAKESLQGNGYKVSENKYIQFGGANYHIEWSANKLIDDYMAFRIQFILDYRNIVETNAMKDGKPTKVKTGTVQITMVSDIMLDYLDKWATGISKLVRPIYDKMNASVIDQRKKTFENDIQNIKNTLQSHFA